MLSKELLQSMILQKVCTHYSNKISLKHHVVPEMLRFICQDAAGNWNYCSS